MYREGNTQEEVRNRMLDRIPDTVSKVEGTFTSDIISAVSGEIEQAYGEMDTLLEKVFAQTSFGEYLERRAAEFGIYRKDGQKATVSVTFNGANGAFIPAGTAVSTMSGLRYYTKEAATIVDGIAVALAEAEDVGAVYNVPAGVIVTLPNQVAGVAGVTNFVAATGGVDVESDDDLRARLAIRVQNPATSGNPDHYRLWAMEVVGIGDAKTIATWNGNGTVKVIVVGSDKRAVSPEKVGEVADYIETVRPIGAEVTVVSAQEKAINVSVNVQLSAGYTLAEVSDNIRANIDKYLKDNAFRRDYISYAVIGSLVMDAEGVEDYSDLRVNGGTANITLAVDEVAVMGTVTVDA